MTATTMMIVTAITTRRILKLKLNPYPLQVYLLLRCLFLHSAHPNKRNLLYLVTTMMMKRKVSSLSLNPSLCHLWAASGTGIQNNQKHLRKLHQIPEVAQPLQGRNCRRCLWQMKKMKNIEERKHAKQSNSSSCCCFQTETLVLDACYFITL